MTMTTLIRLVIRRVALVAAMALVSASVFAVEPDHWVPLETVNVPSARHEAAFVGCDGRFFLLGGRRIQPVDIFDPATRTWTKGAKPPIEIHHFQPVVWQNQIWLAGAMTGKYPHETAIDRILIYDPAKDEWSWGPEIPADRRRGGAGASIHNGSLYLTSGIRNGHWDGWVTWLDRYDLTEKTWHQLPDAPRPRDHFQTAFIGGKLYAAGGRKTSGITKEVFDLTIAEVDVFDLATKTWTTLPSMSNLPTPRAGCFSFVLGDELWIAGGESMSIPVAHAEVQSLNTTTGKWRTSSLFARGRHGTGIVQLKDTLYTCAGSGGRGGSPELDTTEILQLKSSPSEDD